jgi:hypothetical protein
MTSKPSPKKLKIESYDTLDHLLNPIGRPSIWPIQPHFSPRPLAKAESMVSANSIALQHITSFSPFARHFRFCLAAYRSGREIHGDVERNRYHSLIVDTGD